MNSRYIKLQDEIRSCITLIERVEKKQHWASLKEPIFTRLLDDNAKYFARIFFLSASVGLWLLTYVVNSAIEKRQRQNTLSGASVHDDFFEILTVGILFPIVWCALISLIFICYRLFLFGHDEIQLVKGNVAISFANFSHDEAARVKEIAGLLNISMTDNILTIKKFFQEAERQHSHHVEAKHTFLAGAHAINQGTALHGFFSKGEQAAVDIARVKIFPFVDTYQFEVLSGLKA